MKTIRTLCFISVLIFFFFFFSNTGKTDSILYHAYISKDKLAVKQLIDELHNKKESFENSYSILRAQYALLYFNMCFKYEEEIYNTYMNRAQKNVESLIDKKKYQAEVHSIKAGLLGIIIGVSPMKGIYLGSRIDNCITKAIKYNKNHPCGWVVKGRSLISKPSIFGGDIHEGIAHYKKAIKMYEQFNTKYKWEYIDAYFQIALAYKQLSNKVKAKDYLNKVLKIEPDFKMAKWQLKNIDR